MLSDLHFEKLVHHRGLKKILKVRSNKTQDLISGRSPGLLAHSIPHPEPLHWPLWCKTSRKPPFITWNFYKKPSWRVSPYATPLTCLELISSDPFKTFCENSPSSDGGGHSSSDITGLLEPPVPGLLLKDHRLWTDSRVTCGSPRVAREDSSGFSGVWSPALSISAFTTFTRSSPSPGYLIVIWAAWVRPNRDKATGRERNLQRSSSPRGCPGGPVCPFLLSVLLLLGFLLIFGNIIYSNKALLAKSKTI